MIYIDSAYAYGKYFPVFWDHNTRHGFADPQGVEWDGQGKVILTRQGLEAAGLNHHLEVGDVIELLGYRFLIIDHLVWDYDNYVLMQDTPVANRLLMWKLAYEVQLNLIGWGLNTLRTLSLNREQREEMRRFVETTMPPEYEWML